MKNKLIDFVKKNGFLLFLFICVCVVAAGTIYIATKDFRTVDKSKLDDLIILDENLEKPSDVAVIIDTENTAIEVTTEEKVEELTEDSQETAVTDNLEFIEDDYEDDEDVEIVAEKPTQSILPVEGAILTDFTKDTLIYSETLGEWRSHNGIDIRAPEGTKVKAPLDGTIKDVYEDELWGIVIIIDHGDGLETRLANLGTKEMVKPGIKVNKGDYISTVGKSASIEMALEPHVHYEARKSGKLIDPRSISK